MPNCPKWFQMIPNYPTSAYIVSNGFKMCHIVPNVFKLPKWALWYTLGNGTNLDIIIESLVIWNSMKKKKILYYILGPETYHNLMIIMIIFPIKHKNAISLVHNRIHELGLRMNMTQIGKLVLDEGEYTKYQNPTHSRFLHTLKGLTDKFIWWYVDHRGAC